MLGVGLQGSESGPIKEGDARGTSTGVTRTGGVVFELLLRWKEAEHRLRCNRETPAFGLLSQKRKVFAASQSVFVVVSDSHPISSKP